MPIPTLVSKFEIHQYQFLVSEDKVLVNDNITDSIAHLWTAILLPEKLSGPQ